MIQWTSIFCFLALCATLTYADIGSAVAGKVSKCSALVKETKSKLEDAKADGKQAICVISKLAEIVMDNIKGTEMEKSCTPQCEKLMKLMNEDEEEAKKMLAQESNALKMKEWDDKIKQKHEEIKKKDPERAKMYETETKKCQDCGMKHMQEAEKKCGEIKGEAVAKNLRSSCGLS